MEDVGAVEKVRFVKAPRRSPEQWLAGLAIPCALVFLAVEFYTGPSQPGTYGSWDDPNVRYLTEVKRLSISLAGPTLLALVALIPIWFARSRNDHTTHTARRLLFAIPAIALLSLTVQLAYNHSKINPYNERFEPAIATLRSIQQPGSSPSVDRGLSASGEPTASLTTESNEEDDVLCAQITERMRKFDDWKIEKNGCNQTAVVNGVPVIASFSYVGYMCFIDCNENDVTTRIVTPDSDLNFYGMDD